MVSLYKNLTPEEADILGLVLASEGIPYRIEATELGIDLTTPEESYNDAIKSITLYTEENKYVTIDRKPFAERFHKTYSGAFVALLLFVVHWKISDGFSRQSINSIFGSSASRILDGEFYRCATSLLLHADDIHLVGNMVGIAIFGTSVCSITGTGIGWFLILVAGIAGNYLNACFYETLHLSIGASTAVFGAIGILAGYRCLDLVLDSGARLYNFIPLGAGLALLGILGTSAHSDITAHLFGYLAGLLLGVLYRLSFRHPPDELYQNIFLAITAAALIASWSYGNHLNPTVP